MNCRCDLGYFILTGALGLLRLSQSSLAAHPDAGRSADFSTHVHVGGADIWIRDALRLVAYLNMTASAIFIVRVIWYRLPCGARLARISAEDYLLVVQTVIRDTLA